MLCSDNVVCLGSRFFFVVVVLCVKTLRQLLNVEQAVQLFELGEAEGDLRLRHCLYFNVTSVCNLCTHFANNNSYMHSKL